MMVHELEIWRIRIVMIQCAIFSKTADQRRSCHDITRRLTDSIPRIIFLGSQPPCVATIKLGMR